MDFSNGMLWAPLIGLAGGVLLGLAARRGRFCTLGAIEDALYAHDLSRIRMWAVALGVAIAGTFALDAVGLVDLTVTMYAAISWNPVGSVLGGLIFGYGMAIAGNCGFGALARFGGGDLRSLVIVIVTGLSAYAVLSGPLAGLRVALFAPQPSDAAGAATGYAHALSGWIGLAPAIPAFAIAGLILIWALADRRFRRAGGQIFWACIVGIAITSAWAGTTLLARQSFDVVAVESHSFTAPFGETLLYLMTASTGGGPSFAIGSVVGVVIGALLGSLSKGQFRWEACDDPGELGRQILGGVLMGIGGVLAVGCSVGQGLTAFSTLAYSAPIVLAAIVLGAALGLRQLIQGFALHSD